LLLAPRNARVVDANIKAAALFSRGDYAGAIEQYRHEPEFERAIEDERGIAANRVNMSIAYQRPGAAAEAIALLRSAHSRPPEQHLGHLSKGWQANGPAGARQQDFLTACGIGADRFGNPARGSRAQASRDNFLIYPLNQSIGAKNLVVTGTFCIISHF
jgi:tetratricopeptide (TPR) repeat protein